MRYFTWIYPWFAFMLLGFTGNSLASSNPAASPSWVKPLLHQSWDFYKTQSMQGQSHVVSNNYGGTISEGQSYAMLKAVWMDDPIVFHKTWQWTQTHMHRPHDHLLGWKWGNEQLLETENATDADQDIAYALLLAGEKWRQPGYTTAGMNMVNDIWRENVVSFHGHYYINPGTWRGFKLGELTLNPSYFAPYVYRRFARQDPNPNHNWSRLAHDVYETLESCSDLTANKLPPNWCAVDYKTGAIHFSDKQGPGSRNFSYDAFRVFWRMAMDANAGSQPAKLYLKRHTALLTYWQKHHTLPEGFSETGVPLGQAPSGFALSAALAQSHVLNPVQDKPLYQAMLGGYYHQPGYWFNSYNDFLQSVIWLHLYTLSGQGVL